MYWWCSKITYYRAASSLALIILLLFLAIWRIVFAVFRLCCSSVDCCLRSSPCVVFPSRLVSLHRSASLGLKHSFCTRSGHSSLPVVVEVDGDDSLASSFSGSVGWVSGVFHGMASRALAWALAMCGPQARTEGISGGKPNSQVTRWLAR